MPNSLRGLLNQQSISAMVLAALISLVVSSGVGWLGSLNIIGWLTGRPELGEWHKVQPERICRAKTDGFLVAFTGGRGGEVARVRLRTGRKLENLTIRTQNQRYGGVSTPVRSGEYFEVEWALDDRGNHVGRRETITAFWIPLAPVSKTSDGPRCPRPAKDRVKAR